MQKYINFMPGGLCKPPLPALAMSQQTKGYHPSLGPCYREKSWSREEHQKKTECGSGTGVCNRRP